MAISVFVVDGRPVRLSRLKACLGAHPKIELVGACAGLTEALKQIERRAPDAVVVGGELIELSSFNRFAEAARGVGSVIIPVWVFPFSQVEVDALFGDESPPLPGENIRDGDTAFLTETILSAVTRARLETGGSGARKPAGKTLEQLPILIGASTGGVEALHEVLSAFPVDCPPVLVVQHMRANFTTSFIEGLNRACRASVVQAWDGAPLQRGRVYVAPGTTSHLTMAGGQVPYCRLVNAPPRSGHRPSVDALFLSGAGAQVLPVAAILTGMGRDGAEGLQALHRKGAHTIAQSRETCAVYGMPRAAVECGAVTEVVPLAEIGTSLLRAARTTYQRHLAQVAR